VLGLGGDDVSGPRLTEIPGKIVYSKKVATGNNGNTLLQLFVTDQKETRQLTFAEEPHHFAREPAWSPNGKQIAFASGRRALMGSASLYLMAADGSNMRPLKEYPSSKFPLFGNHPVWSPDGRYIAYDRCLNCEAGGRNHEIFVFDLKADTTRRLTHHPGGDRLPTWNPDGEKIAFVSDKDHPGKLDSDLYIMNADGTGLQRLTESGDASIPAWSPGGEKIAFEGKKRSSSFNVFLYDLTSQTATKLTNLQDVERPIWHPHRNRLLVAGVTNSESSVLRLMSPNGEVLQTTERPEGAQQIAWYSEP
jgi:Tol biopolymer transport system component